MTKKLDLETMTGEKEQDQYIINDNREVNDELSMVVINELFNKKNRKTMSRIKVEQVPIITKLFLYSDTFKTKFSRNLANHMLDLNVSIFGLGRKESVQMIQQRNMFGMEQEQPKRSKDIFR